MSLWTIPSSDKMMPLFILDISFPSLKKFLSNPPSMTPSSHKMNFVITGMVLLVLLLECEGADPGGTDSSTGYKRKLFDVFNKTAQYEGDHAQRIRFQWNQENPSQKVSKSKKLYEDAWSVIEDKCKEFERQTKIQRVHVRNILTHIHKNVAKDMPNDRQLVHEKLRQNHPLFQNVSVDLTWSLVHDWHEWYWQHEVQNNLSKWTNGMKATLLYIRDKAREEGKESPDEIKDRWQLLYPKYHIRSTTLKLFIEDIERQRFQPTREEMEKAVAKYERVFSNKKEKGKQYLRIWTDQMNADLAYIASQFDPKDRLFGPKIRSQWGQMNHPYNYMSEYSLMAHLTKLANGNHQPSLLETAYAKQRYDQLPPINEDYLALMKQEISPNDIRNWETHKKFREDLAKYLEVYRESSKKLLEKFNPHDVREQRRGSSPSIPQHSHSDHPSEGETSALHELHHPEIFRAKRTPIHSEPSFPGYGHTSSYEMHHYPNVSGHDTGTPPSTTRTPRRRHHGGGESSTSQEYYQARHMQHSTNLIDSAPLFPEYGPTPGYEVHHQSNVSRHGKGTLPPIPRTHRKSRLAAEAGSSAPPEYHQPALTQNLSTPTHSSPILSEYDYPPDRSIHLSPNITGHETEALPSTSHTPHGSSHQEVGWSPATHDHHQLVLMQNLNAPIYTPEHLTDYGSWSGYGMYPSPSVSGHDTGSPLSTPYRSRPRDVTQEYHQPGYQSPRVYTETGLSPGYSTQTPPPDPVFEPQSHSPRPRLEEGSSTPKARRQQSQE